jgi:hypothetical protein
VPKPHPEVQGVLAADEVLGDDARRTSEGKPDAEVTATSDFRGGGRLGAAHEESTRDEQDQYKAFHPLLHVTNGHAHQALNTRHVANAGALSAPSCWKLGQFIKRWPRKLI